MKILRIMLALVLLVAPIAARALWFYRGAYSRTAPVPTPDYASLMLPTPPVATPRATAPVEQLSNTATRKIVVVDYAHENLFDIGEFDVPAKMLIGLGARVEFATPDSPPLAAALKYADAYVVIAPSLAFAANEVQLVRRFVQRGGRLLVITDPTRGSPAWSVNAANSLLAPFDLLFGDDYLYNLHEFEGNYRNVLFRTFGPGPVMDGLETVALYAAHSVHTTTGTPLAQGDEHTLSSATDTGGNLAALALSANEQVIALGDLTFLTTPYVQIADNSVLAGRLAEFLVGGERTSTLGDFPYLFKQPVAIVPTRSISLTAELVAALGKLQVPLQQQDLPTRVTQDPPPDSDVIVLGRYAPSDDLIAYLKPFFPELSKPITNTETITDTQEFTETIDHELEVYVPGLGRLARSGTGLMLFSNADGQAVLILLADTGEALGRLMNMLARGDTSACTLQAQAALCNLGKPQTKPVSPDLP